MNQHGDKVEPTTLKKCANREATRVFIAFVKTLFDCLFVLDLDLVFACVYCFKTFWGAGERIICNV